MAGAIMWLATMARWSAIFGGMGGNHDDEGGMGMIGLIIMSFLAPMAAMLIQMAVSRSREYLADATGAQFAGHPEGLARALEKISAYNHRQPMQANQSTAHMFIVNPLAGGKFSRLFSTHPPVEERVARLRGGSRPTVSGGPAKSRMADQARDTWDRLSK
jgi:heat shock protein HtpX